MRLSLTLVASVLVLGAGCSCKPNVGKVPPSLTVRPTSVDLGPAKVGDSVQQTVRLEAVTNAAVTISSVALKPGGAPGSVEGFSLGKKPAQVDALSSSTLTVTFSPLAFEAYEAVLEIGSDDAEHPTQRVLLTGEGAKPVLQVTTDCPASRGCVATVADVPPSIAYPAEPLHRPVAIDASKLPAVVVVNAGPVPLVVTKAEFKGPDAAAFAVAGNAALPDGGTTLESQAGFNLPIRFTPTSEAKASYAATLELGSDDPDHPKVSVALSGTLLPNQPPTVCLNLTRVVPPASGDAPREYAAQWPTLLTAPAGGYDFRTQRDVRPGDLAIFSALSDLTDVTKCTTDLEDGRAGLTFAWTLEEAPPGAQALALSGAATPQVQLRPLVTGEYRLALTVTDAQASAVVVPVRFAVAVKQDLVAQLQWVGAAGVDLDLHLVRPSANTNAADPFSGVFSYFEAGPTAKTAGDINGYAVKAGAPQVPGANFDWGGAGSADDPQLNVDDTGSGPLLENISLNSPENDAACATTSCRYQVAVHYFRDARTPGSPLGCAVDGGPGCADGEACGCAAGWRCVANSAPAGDAGVGPGQCYEAPRPVVRLFFHGSATAAASIPLDGLSPPDDLRLGAPCQVLSVAEVEWPARSAIGSLPDGGTPPPVVHVHGADASGRVVSPVVARFGVRQAGGSLQCAPDVSSPTAWFSRQP